eukprot:m.12856 g.12856  ORF g.12856 m.12856 type:complete len:462 (+) comp4373_c0_seq1:132-1517(+)
MEPRVAVVGGGLAFAAIAAAWLFLTWPPIEQARPGTLRGAGAMTINHGGHGAGMRDEHDDRHAADVDCAGQDLDGLPRTIQALCGIARPLVWRAMQTFFRASPPVFRLSVTSVTPDVHKCSNLYKKEMAKAGVQGKELPYTTKFAAELLFPLLLRASPWATEDASDSSDAAMHVIDACIIGQGQQGQRIPTVVRLLRAHPVLGRRFEATGGEGFVMTMTGDHGPCLLFKDRAGKDDYQRTKTKIWHDYSIVNATFLMNEGSHHGGCYSPTKDVVIPTPVVHTLSPLPCAKPDILNRKTKIFLAGRTSSKTRQRIQERYADDPAFYHQGKERLDPDQFRCEMADSVFCLAPRGEAAWSPRLDEAIHAGCIPVVISDDYDPPFWHLLDYSRFSLRFNQSIVPVLKETLLSIDEATLRELHANVKRVAPVFRYSNLEGVDQWDTTMLPLAVYQLYTIHTARQAS